jgi:hypothetical protein
MTQARLSWRFLLSLLALCLPAVCADPVLTGPILGFLFDREAGGVSPILGFPGAASLGPGLNLEMPLVAAEISPRQDHLVGVAAGDAAVVSVSLASGRASARRIDGAAPAPDRIALSPTGSAAALYYRETRVIQTFVGLPDDPSQAGEIDLGAVPGVLTAFAVSDGDPAVLAAFSEGDSGAVFTIQPGGPLRFVLGTRGAAIVRFAAGGDALIADVLDDKVYLVRDAAGQKAAIDLAGAGDGIAAPAGLAVSGSLAFVANSRAGTITVIDLAGGPVRTIDCGCTPTGLAALGGGAVFRLNEPSNSGPLWILDAGGLEPRVFFVPPAVRRATAVEKE